MKSVKSNILIGYAQQGVTESPRGLNDEWRGLFVKLSIPAVVDCSISDETMSSIENDKSARYRLAALFQAVVVSEHLKPEYIIPNLTKPTPKEAGFNGRSFVDMSVLSHATHEEALNAYHFVTSEGPS